MKCDDFLKREVIWVRFYGSFMVFHSGFRPKGALLGFERLIEGMRGF